MAAAQVPAGRLEPFRSEPAYRPAREAARPAERLRSPVLLLALRQARGPALNPGPAALVRRWHSPVDLSRLFPSSWSTPPTHSATSKAADGYC